MKYFSFFVSFLTLGLLTVLFTPSLHAQEFDPFAPLTIPGLAEGTATTTFAVHDSGYLDITLTTDEPVTGRVTSIPGLVQMTFDGSGSTTLTVSGLIPNTPYHLYVDTYEAHTPFTSDTNGSYTFTTDLTDRHFIWIQEKPSTIYLRNDATGGNCTTVGTWDAPTKTCTLNQDTRQGNLQTIRADAFVESRMSVFGEKRPFFKRRPSVYSAI